MRTLILGGTRFIGWPIASTLKKAGHYVGVFHRGSTPVQELTEVEEILGHKAELPHYRDEIRRFRPDAVIDCIGYTPADGSKVIEAFKGWSGQFVFLAVAMIIAHTRS